MPLTYLIVAHLLADFTFQPNRLLKMKYATPFGTFIHVCIFALVAILLLVPYLGFWQTWAVIGGISIVHFFTDIAKIDYSKKNKAFVIPFLTDQIIHLVSLIIGGLILRELDVTYVSGNIYLWFGVLAVIYILFIIDILFIQERESKKLVKSKLFAFTVGFLIYLAVAIFV